MSRNIRKINRSGARYKMAKIAQDTKNICDKRFYTKNGKKIDLDNIINDSINKTVLYRPSDISILDTRKVVSGIETDISVTKEKTQQAARRLLDEGYSRVLALNFASGKNPGGGYLRGALAQEESLASCSALVPSLESQPEYYQANKQAKAPIYTDHIIYSPNVPFFKLTSGELLDEPYFLSIITAPAPNLSNSDSTDFISRVRKVRMHKVLDVARKNDHSVLILGAWGCGAFGNDPEEVASQFKELIDNEFNNVFRKIVFAIYGVEANYNVFKKEFEG